MDSTDSMAITVFQGRCINPRAVITVTFVSALLGQQYLAPAAAFCATTSFHAIASRSSEGLGKPPARSRAPRRSRFELFGIKRKVKVDFEENFSGKVVDNAGPMSGMMVGGGDPNALFEVIERNKRKAEEKEAARNAAEEEEEGEGEGGSEKVGEFEDHDGGGV